MVPSRAISDMERATIRKATVSTVPPWAKDELLLLLKDDNDFYPNRRHGSVASSSASTLVGHSTKPSSLPRRPSSPATISASIKTSTFPAQWSVFATMSNVSTMSERLSMKRFEQEKEDEQKKLTPAATLLEMKAQHFSSNVSRLERHPQRLRENFKSKIDDPISLHTSTSINMDGCICSCHQHQHQQLLELAESFKTQWQSNQKGARKQSLAMMRGYPTGQCVSSSDPPPRTAWDEEQGPEDSLSLQQRQQQHERRHSMGTNTAFNLETLKMLINSPLFSNFVKALTAMAAVLMFAIALDAILLLHRQHSMEAAIVSPLTNASTSLYITLVLSILTIVYSCFIIFLDSRRPPEGLDSSKSKPLIVIFSEIMASIIWAQMLSVSIYVYTWTLGCTDAGARQLDQWLSSSLSPPSSSSSSTSPPLSAEAEKRHHHLVEGMCRRGGTIVGLEVLLVLLLIFNFYTHLAHNFRFIRAVSR